MDRPRRLLGDRPDRSSVSGTGARSIGRYDRRSPVTASLFRRRRPQTIDAAKVGRIDDLALAIDDELAFQGELDGRAPHLAQMGTPAELVLAPRLSERPGRVGRADGATLRRPGAKAGDDLLDGGVRF